MARRTVALTGATGFFGRHLAEGLVAAGWRVRALVRPGRSPGPGIETVTGDLDDVAALDRLVAGADAVMHAAAAVAARRPADFAAVNVEGTARLLDRARRHAPAAHVVLVSSLTAREPGLSAYAASKALAEERARGLVVPERLLIVRPPALYGPFDRATLVVFRSAGLPLTPLLGRGVERIALLHAADAASAVLDLLDRRAGGEFALADGRPSGYGMREIFVEAARAQGRRVRFVPIPTPLFAAAGRLCGGLGDVLRRPMLLTSDKVREMLHEDWSVDPAAMPPGLGARARGIREGFAQTVAWYRQAGWL